MRTNRQDGFQLVGNKRKSHVSHGIATEVEDTNSQNEIMAKTHRRAKHKGRDRKQQ
jgi:hypothetical protein